MFQEVQANPESLERYIKDMLIELHTLREMVDTLAQRSDLIDATKLEALWNHLGERTPSNLMCGYSAAHFVSTSTHRANVFGSLALERSAFTNVSPSCQSS